MTSMVSVKDAAIALAGMEGFEEGLRRRTEGITWMVLGMTLAGIGATCAAGLMLTELGALEILWPLQIVLPFLAWSAAGVAATAAVWRSAALHATGLDRRRMARRLVFVFAALFAVTWPLMGMSYELGLSHPEWKQYAAFTVVFGLDAVVLGVWNVLSLSDAGRRTALRVGLAQVLVGVVVLALQTDHPLGYVAALGAIPAGWFVGGFLQTLRG